MSKARERMSLNVPELFKPHQVFQIFCYLNKWACRGSLILIMFVLSICTSFDRQEWGVAIEGLGKSVWKQCQCGSE